MIVAAVLLKWMLFGELQSPLGHYCYHLPSHPLVEHLGDADARPRGQGTRGTATSHQRVAF